MTGEKRMGVPENVERAQTLRQWLRERVSDWLEVAPESVDMGCRFRDLGLGSKQLVSLVGELASRSGKRLRATAAWEHPTPEALLQHVESIAVEAALQVGPAQRTVGATRDPIAIIGMGLRLPGAVSSPEEFWELLCTKGSGVREVPRSRFDVSSWFDADPAAPGKLSTRWAGLVEDIEQFDADFFGISPREARQMDPQQRLALELAWEALEDAAVDPLSLRDQPVGVFMGAMWSDYARIMHSDVTQLDVYSATGQDTSIISARVSYVLGLAGASLTVNTACSSSAVAIHLALQSLHAGETTLALAGGVSVVASAESTVAMTKFGAMNPAGQCRAFDAGAGGYVRGEGGGVLVLKPVSRAVAAGDHIYSVIRGSAVNNDGFSNGLTAPNPAAQQAVIQQALRSAGLEAAAVQYVETHGPGTAEGVNVCADNGPLRR